MPRAYILKIYKSPSFRPIAPNSPFGTITIPRHSLALNPFQGLGSLKSTHMRAPPVLGTGQGGLLSRAGILGAAFPISTCCKHRLSRCFAYLGSFLRACWGRGPLPSNHRSTSNENKITNKTKIKISRVSEAYEY